MKLVYAIVRKDNEDEVMNELTVHRFSVTKLATTGGPKTPLLLLLVALLLTQYP